ncbi:MAG TPA: DoxX family protein [Longimicrobiaceae bacterium]|nr:DoxX family protein [Longimicrobiaceae bacterium]
MNILLWILQVVLAGVFAAHGWLLVSPPPELLPIINEEMGVVFRYTLGIAEIMGAIGILLPAATRIMPWLTEVSAACFAFVMVSATIWHIVRAEWSSAVITFALLIISAFVAYGRWRVRPIRPKQLATTALP